MMHTNDSRPSRSVFLSLDETHRPRNVPRKFRVGLAYKANLGALVVFNVV